MFRFIAGLIGGGAASGVTYAITQESPWWWSVGLFVLCLIWFGEAVLVVLND